MSSVSHKSTPDRAHLAQDAPAEGAALIGSHARARLELAAHRTTEAVRAAGGPTRWRP